MTGVNWGLAGNAQRGFQNALAFGMQMGAQARQAQERRDEKNALAAFVSDPNEKTAAAVAPYNPGLAYQYGQDQRAAAAQQREQARADLPMAIRLLEGATDEASYQRNTQLARQYGIDVSRFPQNFDPVWREQNLATLKLLATPQGQEALSTAGKQAADEGFQPGSPEFQARVTQLVNASNITTHSVQPGGTIIQNDKVTGEQRVLVQGQGFGGGQAASPEIPSAAVDALRRGEGTPEQFDEIFGQGAAARVMGGASSNASGGFPPVR